MRTLPENLREQLREPIGPVVKGDELEKILLSADILVAVGDVVTSTAISVGITPDIAVLDGATKREEELEIPKGYWDIEVWVYNPPNTITDALLIVLEKAFYNLRQGMKTLIVVDGEEDLATLPCISMAPHGTTVIYGMPNVGVAVVQVDQRSKEISKNIIDQMEMI